MNRALLMDRDGIINKDGHYLYRPNDIEFMEGIFDICRIAQNKKYKLIIVTNQSGIARGMYGEDDLAYLNQWMRDQFRRRHVQIDAIYYCPYHPQKGVGKYKIDSRDRKPNPGMILKAQRAFGLDLKKSIMLGDRDSDMEAGRRAGVGKLILLPGQYQYSLAADVTVVKKLTDVANYLEF